MNTTANTFRICGKSILMATMLLASVPTLAAEHWLRSEPLNVTMADGVSVPMWGFASCEANYTLCSAPSVPGPALVVPAGDNSLTVHVSNTLPEPVSIIINGQQMPDGSAPVWTDGTQGPRTSASQRVRSFTHEAAALGGTATYVWNNVKSGTYLYQSGTHPQVQVQMGLYGAMTSDGAAAAVQNYAGLAYDRALTLLFSEIDTNLHNAVANGTYGTPSGPTSTLDYNPEYFLLNGKTYQSTDLPLATVNAGETILLRFLNAGLRTRAPMISNGHIRILAEDGNLYPWNNNPRKQYSVLLPAAKTIDALYIAQTVAGQDALISIFDRRLGLTTGEQLDGGMMAHLDVKMVGVPPIITEPAPGVVYYATQDAPFTMQVTGMNQQPPQATVLGKDRKKREKKNSHSRKKKEKHKHSNRDKPHRHKNGHKPHSHDDDDDTSREARKERNKARLEQHRAKVRARLESHLADSHDDDDDFDEHEEDEIVRAPLGLIYTLLQKPYGMNIDSQHGLMSWTPDGNQVGSHPVSVRVTDETGLYKTAAFSIDVAGKPNTAPVAVKDSYFVTAGSVLTVTAAQGILINDTDVDGDTLTSIAHLAQTAGTVTPVADGGFSYTPPFAGFAGLDTGVDAFTYRAYDGVDYSNPTTVTINVLANRAPVAVPDTATAAIYVATQVYADVLIDVLKNDTDADAVFDPDNGIVKSSVSIVVPAANGQAMVDTVTGIIRYTPNENFQGVDTFSYNVKDAHDATSNTAQVTVTVK